jgi:hypothetical protein
LCFATILFTESALARLTALAVYPAVGSTGLGNSALVMDVLLRTAVRCVVSFVSSGSGDGQPASAFEYHSFAWLVVLVSEVAMSVVEAAVYVASDGSVAATLGWRAAATLVQHGVRVAASFF